MRKTVLMMAIGLALGGCAGSTGGGIKMIRILTVLKVAWRELGKLARPRLISPFKIGDETIPESRVMNILALFNLFMILFMFASLVMCLYTDDVMTAVTSVAATLFNIGPGLNGVGAIENYAWIPIPGKILLSLCMLLGRLEVFSVLIALRPDIWKK
nr:potassium transporter TrkG [bacterium]